VTFRTRGDQWVIPSTSVPRDPRLDRPIATDRITVIAAMRTCGTQLVRSRPAALYVSLPALSPSKGEVGRRLRSGWLR
jgi:hypothetical protein